MEHKSGLENLISLIEFWVLFPPEIRYATPCFMLGTFLGLVAVIIAIGGRCTGPDRTLICSSLHILAGTIINFEQIKIRTVPNRIQVSIDSHPQSGRTFLGGLLCAF